MDLIRKGHRDDRILVQTLLVPVRQKTKNMSDKNLLDCFNVNNVLTYNDFEMAMKDSCVVPLLLGSCHFQCGDAYRGNQSQSHGGFGWKRSDFASLIHYEKRFEVDNSLG